MQAGRVEAAQGPDRQKEPDSLTRAGTDRHGHTMADARNVPKRPAQAHAHECTLRVGSTRNRETHGRTGTRNDRHFAVQAIQAHAHEYAHADTHTRKDAKQFASHTSHTQTLTQTALALQPVA